MKHLLTLLIGLFIGVFATVAIFSAMRKGVPYDGAVMRVMAQQMSTFKDMRDADRCEAVEIQRHLLVLNAVSGEIENAFPSSEEDGRFGGFAQDLRDAVVKVQELAPATCKTLAEASGTIGSTCKACHDVFR